MADRPWIPERDVSAELAALLIESQFPELAPARLETLGVGWDNVAYLVNDSLVFRFPRRELAAGLLEAEGRVLPRIASHLPLAIPTPLWIGRPADGYPWSFAGYPRLPGRTADVAALDDEARARIAPPLGRFLATLHAIGPSGLDAPGDSLHRADVARRNPQTLERLAVLERREVVEDATPWRRIVEETPAPEPYRRRCLVHGDVYARHLLVDEAGVLSGLIDWGDIHVGDPAVDLQIAHGFLPASARAAFLAAYGPVDADTWTLARLRALFHAVAITYYGDDVGDEPLRREGIAAMNHVLQGD